MKKSFVLFLLSFSFFLIGCNKEKTKEPEKSSQSEKTSVTEQTVKYTVTYDLDGGECEGLIYEFEEGKPFELPTPTKEGFDFVNWVEGDIVVKKLEDRNYNLKATWELKKISVKVINKDTGEELDNRMIEIGSDYNSPIFVNNAKKGYMLKFDKSIENLTEDTILHCTLVPIINGVIFASDAAGNVYVSTVNLKFIGITIKFDAEGGKISSKFADASTKTSNGQAKFIYIATQNIEDETDLFTYNSNNSAVFDVKNIEIEAYYYNEDSELVSIEVNAIVVNQ